MKKLLFFIIAIICICFFVFYKQDRFEDKGIWVKLSEDIPEGGYLLHNNYVYGCYLDTLSDIDKIPPLKGVDVSTFEVCKGTEYARDKNRVYYPVRTISIDGEDFGYTYFEEYILKKEYLYGLLSDDANPKSFKYIGEGYAIDGNIMFRYGKRIKWNNSFIEKTQ